LSTDLRDALVAIMNDCNEFVQAIAMAGTHGPALSKSRMYAAVNVIYRRAGDALRAEVMSQTSSKEEGTP